MRLVDEVSVFDVKLPKHPHQDVQEMGELSEQRPPILSEGSTPRPRRVVPFVSVPQTLNVHLKDLPKST